MQRRVWDLPAAKGRPGKGMGNTHPQVTLWFYMQSGNSRPVLVWAMPSIAFTSCPGPKLPVF